MRTLYFLVLCTLIAFVACQSPPINSFQASFLATETLIGSGDRQYGGTMYYSDNWVESTGAGHEAIRFDINLNNGAIATTLTQLSIYEDQYFRFTICHTCSWQDIFAEEPLPKLYFFNTDAAQGQENIGGIPTDRWVFTQTNVVGVDYVNYVTLWTRQASPRWPVQANISTNAGTHSTLLQMSGWQAPAVANAFNVPAGCPSIDPGCFRLDLAFVIDVSGSVGDDGAEQERQFVLNMINTFLIGPKYLAASLSTFADCFLADIKIGMTFDKNFLVNTLTVNVPNLFDSNGFTCIVGGIQRGWWTFGTINGSRPATRKSMIVLTDGNGNRPCSDIGVLEDPDQRCDGVLHRAQIPCIPVGSNCEGADVCDAGPCCQIAHDCHLEEFYAATYSLYQQRVFAIGVTNAISDATLVKIVNDPAALARGETRIVRVSNFGALNSIISALAKAILCEVPGSESCPNDCLPDGFCCGGSCQCVEDCSAQSTDCQISTCHADRNGARCVLGAPDNASCVDPTIQCQNRFCLPDVGCRGTPNDALTCTDNNACTVDVCLNGNCSLSVNSSVTQCDDHNQCTQVDQCLPDGTCRGTPNDGLACTDGNACTDDQCINGTCVSVAKTCPDDTITDCKIPSCNPATGVCEVTFVQPGFQCLPPDPNDKCTVFVCIGYNPNTARQCQQSGGTNCNFGQCVARTRDSDDCKGDSDNTAAIIGGVIGGVALLCILLLIALILLLILCRKNVISAVGNLNPFAASTNVKNAATYVSPMGSGTSGLYEHS